MARKKLQNSKKVSRKKSVPAKRKALRRAPLSAKKQKKPVSKKRKILDKSSVNPILAPNPEHEWEAWQVFNPGVILLADSTHFMYRAIGTDGISRFGYAASQDGFHIAERLPYPAYEHKTKHKTFNVFSYSSGGSFSGAEDPRLTRVGAEKVLYMTYTACDEGLRMALTSIAVDDFLAHRWKWKPPVFLSPPDEVHKNWVIFPEKIRGRYAILHNLTPDVEIAYVDDLLFDDNRYIRSNYMPTTRKNCWDGRIRGVGAPPLKTKYGWLVLYHAMENDDFSKYKVGAMILDEDDPTRVLHRSPVPVLEPSEPYEHTGYKGGVVYVTGVVEKNGTLFIYYGAADSTVGVACAPLETFLSALMRGEKPAVLTTTITKKK